MSSQFVKRLSQFFSHKKGLSFSITLKTYAAFRLLNIKHEQIEYAPAKKGVCINIVHLCRRLFFFINKNKLGLFKKILFSGNQKRKQNKNVRTKIN